MKEFKFIRGKYTNESIFDSNVTENALFAFDSEGEQVNLASTNNKAFQEYFAEKFSDKVGDIFTFLPSQFSFEGELTRPDGGDPYYRFTSTVNEHPSQDANIGIPSKVLTAAKDELEAKLTTDANPETVPLYIDENDKLNSFKKVVFTYDNNSKKAFERNCHFQLKGKVQERSYGKAIGQPTEAYKLVDGLIDSSSSIKNATFNNGKLQKEAASVSKKIINDTQPLGESSTISLASKYAAAEGYSFIPDGGSRTNIKSYVQGDEIKLYKNINSGLMASNYKDALGVPLSRLSRVDGSSDTIYSLSGDVFSAVSDDALAVGLYYRISDDGTELAYNNNGVLTKITENNIYTSGNFSESEKLSSIGTVQLETSANVLYTVNDIVETNIIVSIVNHISNSNTDGSTNDEYDLKLTYSGGTLTFSNGVSLNEAKTAAKSLYGGNIKKYTKATIVSPNTQYYIYRDGTSLVASNVEKLSQSVEVYAQYYRNVKSGYAVYESDLTKYTKDAGINVYIEPANVSSLIEVLCSSDDNHTPSKTLYYFKIVENSNTPIAFVHKTDFTIPTYGDKIIYGYDPSYAGLYVLVSDNSKPEDSSLRELTKNDLDSKASINVYTDSNLYCFGDKCYTDDSESEDLYVAYNKDWITADFTKDNVEIGANNIIRPVITADVDRKIHGEYSVTVFVD